VLLLLLLPQPLDTHDTLPGIEIVWDLMADILKAYAVALASLLAGAAFVHSIYKPDLVRTHRVTSRQLLEAQ
jgi:hypothetical protein